MINKTSIQLILTRINIYIASLIPFETLTHLDHLVERVAPFNLPQVNLSQVGLSMKKVQSRHDLFVQLTCLIKGFLICSPQQYENLAR